MSLVAVAGAKSAAGITTTATALAAVWPATAILADCDPAGGDLALRLRAADGAWLARDVGVVGLAAAARMQPGDLDACAQLQTAMGGLPVLAGVDSPMQALRIGGLWTTIAETLRRSPGMDVLADCGRLSPGLPNAQVIARADLLLLVARATAESVAHLRQLLEALLADETLSAAVHVGVIADADTIVRDLDDVRAALIAASLLDIPVSGLALDPSAAAGLAGTPTRGLDRSPLIRSARSLASELYDELRQPADAAAISVAPVAAPVEVG